MIITLVVPFFYSSLSFLSFSAQTYLRPLDPSTLSVKAVWLR